MRIVPSITIVLLALGSVTAARAATPCQMQVLGEMTLKMDEEVPLVDAAINGKPARMMIDTGSDTTLIFAQTAADYGVVALKMWGGAQSYGIGGGSDIGMARLKSFKLAGLTATDYDVPVSGRALGAAQGLVGSNFLRHWIWSSTSPTRKCASSRRRPAKAIRWSIGAPPIRPPRSWPRPITTSQ